jgi:hypothetical protein
MLPPSLGPPEFQVFRISGFHPTTATPLNSAELGGAGIIQNDSFMLEPGSLVLSYITFLEKTGDGHFRTSPVFT